jgi:hypothetical protein
MQERHGTMRLTVCTLAAALFAALLLPADADAQTYRCVGKDGKKYYGQSVPPQCLGMPVEELNAQGMVTRRFDAAATAADRGKKEAEDAERKKREAISKEEGRRNRALLATYTSEDDIDAARARALKENEASMKDIERKIAAMKADRAKAAKDMEFFDAKKLSGQQQLDKTKLDQRLKNYDFDIETQQQLLATKQKEVDVINARYDDDKKRYRELTKPAK